VKFSNDNLPPKKVKFSQVIDSTPKIRLTIFYISPEQNSAKYLEHTTIL